MDGKEKCRYLRSVRKTIAEENNIDMEFEECTYEGECRGTCPKCDSELEFLNGELEKRKEAGEKVVIPTDNAKTQFEFRPLTILKELVRFPIVLIEIFIEMKQSHSTSIMDTIRQGGICYGGCEDESVTNKSLIRVGESYGTEIEHSAEEIEAVKNGPLAGLELSEMSLRLLMRSGKFTVKDVLEMDEEALSRLKQLNENCYSELIYKVHFWELKFDYENNNK